MVRTPPRELRALLFPDPSNFMSASNSRRTWIATRHVINPSRGPNRRLTKSLRSLMLGLAKHLLPVGITPKYFGDLMYGAFVEAAADISRCRNGRVNRSRIAVLTSLRRAEVKRLLVESSATSSRNNHEPKTHKVVAAWMADRRYVNSKGRPRRLPLRGRHGSFASLVREFAGDVTPRAVLEELRRLDMVSVDRGCMNLIRTPHAPSRDIDPIVLDLIEILLDGLDATNQRKPSNVSPRLYRASLGARDSVDLMTMSQRARDGAGAFIEGLERSLSTPRPSKGYKGVRRGLTVTVLVREHPGTHLKGAK
jgi:Family of unknown function (DUF6502)